MKSILYKIFGKTIGNNFLQFFYNKICKYFLQKKFKTKLAKNMYYF